MCMRHVTHLNNERVTTHTLSGAKNVCLLTDIIDHDRMTKRASARGQDKKREQKLERKVKRENKRARLREGESGQTGERERERDREIEREILQGRRAVSRAHKYNRPCYRYD